MAEAHRVSDTLLLLLLVLSLPCNLRAPGTSPTTWPLVRFPPDGQFPDLLLCSVLFFPGSQNCTLYTLLFCVKF